MSPPEPQAPQGHLALVLHAHLPYVRHPEHPFFLEEDWLYEAITETYLPLLQVLESLAADRVPFALTLSMSPPLLGMLTDELLCARYSAHLTRLGELIDKERLRNRASPHLLKLTDHYGERWEAAWRTWQHHGGNLVRAFSALQDQGYLDILTCAATHGYLPLLQVTPRAVQAQLEVGVKEHVRHFGRPPTGIWLPECGFYRGLDRHLAGLGLRYFVAEAHALLFARPRPRCGLHGPVFCTDSGVAAFGRDLESSLQVWSRAHGYPGDSVYREFYRDIGYDLDLGYIGPYVQPGGGRKNTGIKYHRITGQTEHKELYDPGLALQRVAQHAGNFMFNRERQIEHLQATLGGAPIVVAPFDAELFGHWWYEGPWWLEQFLRQSATKQRVFRLTHLAGYLKDHPTHPVCRPASSSWGDGGYNAFWLNLSTEWIYPHLHRAAERMVALARDYPVARGLVRRALDQCARELLLAQASDWAFIMRTGTMRPYAEQRTRCHLQRFARLHDDIRSGLIDEAWLSRLEYLDNIFPELDYAIYAPQ